MPSGSCTLHQSMAHKDSLPNSRVALPGTHSPLNCSIPNTTSTDTPDRSHQNTPLPEGPACLIYTKRQPSFEEQLSVMHCQQQ